MENSIASSRGKSMKSMSKENSSKVNKMSKVDNIVLVLYKEFQW